MNSNKKIKVTSSDEMLGKYVTWAFNVDLDANENRLLGLIARETLGKSKRYAYIKQSIMTEHMSKRTLFSKRKSLSEKGLIKWRKTVGYTSYELILPKEITDKYEFIFQ
jgi:hypothetical protein